MNVKQELIDYIKRLTPEQAEDLLFHPIIVEAMKKQKGVNHNEE